MNSRNLLIALALVFTHTTMLAQQPWSLSDCINYAHENNIQIKRTELQSHIAEIEELQAKTNILPTLNADISRNYSFGRTVDQYTNRFISENSISDNYSISSNIAIFAGLQNYNNIQRTKYSTLASVTNIDKAKIEITLQISSAYLDILFKKELLEITKNQQAIVYQQVDRTSKLVKAGNVARGDLLEIQAQLANESLNVTNTNNDLNVSFLNLVQLLDLDSVSGFDIIVPDTIDPDFIKELPAFNTVYEEALIYLPHIKEAQFQVKSNEYNLLRAKGERSPRLYLSASIYTGYSDQRSLIDTEAPLQEQEVGYLQGFPNQVVVTQVTQSKDYPYADQFNDNLSERVSVGLSFPILNKWQTNNNIARAKIQLEDSKYNLEQIEQNLMKEIQQAYNDAVSAKEQYYASTKAVKSYREAFVYTEQKLQAGMVNAVEYSIAKNNYIKAESDQLQARYAFVFALKILDFYRGIPITL